mgnify:CR=1 FL=1
MVCSFCSQSGHNFANCQERINARARCIFENGYDPIFHESDKLNRKYWWKRITVRNNIVNSTGYYVINGNRSACLKMVYPNELLGGQIHIGEIIEDELDLPREWQEVVFNNHYVRNEVSIIGAHDPLWEAPPKSWFSRGHNANLNVCFGDRVDAISTRIRIIKRLVVLHREHYYSNFDEAIFMDYEETQPSTQPSTPTPNLPREIPRIDLANLPPPPADTQPTNVTVSDATTCGVCWDELGNANIMVTKCGHKFCCDCILSHFQLAAGNNCPLCREEYGSRVTGWLPPQEAEDPPRRGRGRPRRRVRDTWNENEMPHLIPSTPSIPTPPAIIDDLIINRNLFNSNENTPIIPVNNILHDNNNRENAATRLGEAILVALENMR